MVLVQGVKLGPNQKNLLTPLVLDAAGLRDFRFSWNANRDEYFKTSMIMKECDESTWTDECNLLQP